MAVYVGGRSGNVVAAIPQVVEATPPPVVIQPLAAPLAGLTAAANQTLGVVTQTATVGDTAGLVAAQNLAPVLQGASVSASVSAPVFQALSSVVQSAAIGVSVSASAVQTLPSITQAAAVGDAAQAGAAQTLAAHVSSATIQARQSVVASQTLAGVSQSLSLLSPVVIPNIGLTLGQTLAPVGSSAVLTARQWASVTQALPGVTQSLALANALQVSTSATLAPVTQVVRLSAGVPVVVEVGQALPSVSQATGITLLGWRRRIKAPPRWTKLPPQGTRAGA